MKDFIFSPSQHLQNRAETGIEDFCWLWNADCSVPELRMCVGTGECVYVSALGDHGAGKQDIVGNTKQGAGHKQSYVPDIERKRRFQLVGCS